MNIYIPKSSYQIVPKEVYSSIKNQTSFLDKVNIIEISAGIKIPCKKHRLDSRNLIFDIARHIQDDFFLMLDSNTVITENHVIESMYSKIQLHTEIGALSLSTTKIKEISPLMHTDIACTLIKTKALKNFTFKFLHSEIDCECLSFTMGLHENGYKHFYYSKNPMIKTVRREEYGKY